MSTYSKLFFLLIPFLFACKAKKNLPPHTEKCRLDYKSAKTLASLVKKNQADYSTFSGKIKSEVVIDDQSREFTISLRLKKDSIIWASISPALGIEVIQFVATKDSLKFIDRLHGKYFIGDYDTLGKMLNTEIDLEILQSLLLGNSVEFYEEDEKLRPGIDSCKYILGTIRKRKLRKVLEKGKELKEPAQIIWMHDSTFKICRILFREFGTGREFDARFTNYQNAEVPEEQLQKPLLPFDITYYVKTDKTITINLMYTKAIVNKPQKFIFTIPKSYTPIEKKTTRQ